MLSYIHEHWLEITGAILSLIYLYLSINQKISLWILGFISSAFYIVIFLQTKLYADMSLQVYYLVISVYGWIHWTFGKEIKGDELPVAKLSKKLILILTGATVLIYFLYFIILNYYTDSPVPKFDSLVGTLSVIATWLLAKKYIENWLVWIVADGLCIGLYIYKGLYPTSVLFGVYTLMSVVGYLQWKKSK